MLVWFTASLLAAAGSECDSVARCNTAGTAAYQAGDHAVAADHFRRQIDYAETAIKAVEYEDGEVTPALQKARETALNNALLNAVKAGRCLEARVWLRLVDGDTRAAQANFEQFDQRCPDVADTPGWQGDYWQYVGHGSFNVATLRPRADGGLDLDAFYMRISMGPLDQYGPAAFGEHYGVALAVKDGVATGQYDSYEEGVRCTITLQLGAQEFAAAYQDDDRCNTGGAGAVFGGVYQRVDSTPSPPSSPED